MASTLLAMMASNLLAAGLHRIAMACNQMHGLLAMAYSSLVMAPNLIALASTLLAMGSNPLAVTSHGPQPTSDDLQPSSDCPQPTENDPVTNAGLKQSRPGQMGTRRCQQCANCSATKRARKHQGVGHGQEISMPSGPAASRQQINALSSKFDPKKLKRF